MVKRSYLCNNLRHTALDISQLVEPEDKKMNVKFLLAGLLVIMLVGCASMSIDEQNKRLSRLELGMTKEQVLKIMPGGTAPRGPKLYPNGPVTVLEYKAGTYAPFDFSADFDTGMITQTTWLYFYNGKLIHWGGPEDWPANPDAKF